MYSFPMYIPEFAARYPDNSNSAKQFNWVVVLPEDNYSLIQKNFLSFSVILLPRYEDETDLDTMYIINFEADFMIFRSGEETVRRCRKFPLPVYRRDIDKIHQIFIEMPDVEEGDVMNVSLCRRGSDDKKDTFDGHMDIWGGSVDVHMDWGIEDELPSIAPVAEREPEHIRMN